MTVTAISDNQKSFSLLVSAKKSLIANSNFLNLLFIGSPHTGQTLAFGDIVAEQCGFVQLIIFNSSLKLGSLSQI
jgi:hypothetical protein